MLKSFINTIIKDKHQPIKINTIDDFSKTDVGYEQRIANENWTFDAKPRDKDTGNEIAINNQFVYKFLLLERRLSAYRGLDYWDFIRSVVNSRDHTRILSIGSGPCAIEMEIAEKFAKPYVIDCLDLNENLINDATRRARERGMNLRPLVADLNQIEFDKKYDLVIICAALHHFVELETVLERIHEALNNDGLFVTYEPVMRSGMFLFPATRVWLGLLFLLLPSRLRVNNQDYPGEKRLDRYYNEIDRSAWTFESIRSGEIPELLPKFFRTVHFGRGMTFLRRVSDTIYGPNYRLENRGDRILVEVLCWIDRFFRFSRLLRPEGLFYIGSKKDQPKRPASVSTISRQAPSQLQTHVSAPLFVPPGHFYSPIVDPSSLSLREDSIFGSTPPVGIDVREGEQVMFAKSLPTLRASPQFPANADGPTRYHYKNGAFSYGDATILAAMMLKFRPKRIVEFGSGYSSALMLDVNESDCNNEISLTFVDPFPDTLNKILREEDRRRHRVMDVPAHGVPYSLAEELEPGDIYFMDTTHIVKTGSDVIHHFQKMLPRLSPGVIIHIHDIFYPFEYPRPWVMDMNLSWNELYYVQAFLTDNQNYEILFWNDFIAQHHISLMAEVAPTFCYDTGSSFWIRKK